jgi:hypothetical protein
MKVKREKCLGEKEFVHNYLSVRQPVIITEEAKSWPALDRWNWQYFRRLFSDHEVDVYDHWFMPTGCMKLGDFIGKSIGASAPDPNKSYVRWFARHLPGDGRWADDVFHAIEGDWRYPAFLPADGYVVPFVNSKRAVSAVTDSFPYRAIFLSAAGASTAMHMDPWMSSAVLCQVVGTKSFSMYAPTRHDGILQAVMDGQDRRKIAEMVPTMKDVLRPGEILFIPDGWWHHVTTLTDSISMTWNFVHITAAARFIEYVRSNPDDPELDVVSYLLSNTVSGNDTPRDIIAIAEKVITAQEKFRI